MLIVRAGGAGRSAGTSRRPASMPPKCPPVMHRRPPPTCRKSPVSAGSARIRASRRRRRRAAGVRGRAGSRWGACARAASERDARARPAGRSLGGPLDGPLGEARLELGPALRAAREPLAILRALVEHDPHQPERERRIRARARGDVLVAALGRVRAQRVDRHDVRAAARAASTKRHWWNGREQVRAPQDHEPRVLEVLGIHATEPP